MLSKTTRLAVSVLLLSATLALAHEGMTGVIKERMDLMDSQKDAMKVIGLMAKGKAPFDAAKAAKAARDIETTAKRIHELFPEGSTGGKSEAKPEIWTNWEEFTGDADALKKAAATLAGALENGSDNWKADFQEVSNACKTCHESFREEEDE